MALFMRCLGASPATKDKSALTSPLPLAAAATSSKGPCEPRQSLAASSATLVGSASDCLRCSVPPVCTPNISEGTPVPAFAARVVTTSSISEDCLRLATGDLAPSTAAPEPCQPGLTSADVILQQLPTISVPTPSSQQLLVPSTSASALPTEPAPPPVTASPPSSSEGPSTPPSTGAVAHLFTSSLHTPRSSISRLSQATKAAGSPSRSRTATLLDKATLRNVAMKDITFVSVLSQGTFCTVHLVKVATPTNPPSATPNQLTTTPSATPSPAPIPTFDPLLTNTSISSVTLPPELSQSQPTLPSPQPTSQQPHASTSPAPSPSPVPVSREWLCVLRCCRPQAVGLDLGQALAECMLWRVCNCPFINTYFTQVPDDKPDAQPSPSTAALDTVALPAGPGAECCIQVLAEWAEQGDLHHVLEGLLDAHGGWRTSPSSAAVAGTAAGCSTPTGTSAAGPLKQHQRRASLAGRLFKSLSGSSARGSSPRTSMAGAAPTASFAPVREVMEPPAQPLLPEPNARFVFACLTLALQYLHRNKGAVHCDVKPANLLVLRSGYVQLADLNAAQKIGPDGRVYAYTGTPHYMAPELLDKDTVHSIGFGTAADLYSAGVTLFQCLTGHTLLEAAGLVGMRQSGRSASPEELWAALPQLLPKDTSQQLRDLLAALLQPEPTQRITIDEIFKHAWYDGFDWRALMKCKMTAPALPEM